MNHRLAIALLGIVCLAPWPPLPAQEVRPFKRGEVLGDDELTIGDAVASLNDLFLGANHIFCDDAADANDDGQVDVADPVFTLGYLFLGSTAPPAPFPDCGTDPTGDDLGCDQFLCPPCGDECVGPGLCVPTGPDTFACTQSLATCEDVQRVYEFLTSGAGQTCEELAGTCQILFGHCGIGLGGCYYAAPLSVSQSQLDALGERYRELGCIGPVCRCTRPPAGAECVLGTCQIIEDNG